MIRKGGLDQGYELDLRLVVSKSEMNGNVSLLERDRSALSLEGAFFEIMARFVVGGKSMHTLKIVTKYISCNSFPSTSLQIFSQNFLTTLLILLPKKLFNSRWFLKC